MIHLITPVNRKRHEKMHILNETNNYVDVFNNFLKTVLAPVKTLSGRLFRACDASFCLSVCLVSSIHQMRVFFKRDPIEYFTSSEEMAFLRTLIYFVTDSFVTCVFFPLLIAIVNFQGSNIPSFSCEVTF